MVIKVSIESILLGVTENVIGNLNIGNGYTIEKDTLMNKDLMRKFDYTDFGIRRIYDRAIVDDKLSVAVLRKKFILENTSSVDIEAAIATCDDFEEKEVEYLDSKMRMIRFFCENGFNIKEVLFRYEILSQNGDIEENINSKRPFPDRIYNKTEKLNLIEYSELNDFLKNFEQSIINCTFDNNLLKEVLFLFDQSYYAPVETLRFMVCVIGLESIFARNGKKISYILSKCIGNLLANNEEESKKISNKVKKIYKKRCKYVHEGNGDDIKGEDIVEVREILRKVINALIKLNKSKKELFDYLKLK